MRVCRYSFGDRTRAGVVCATERNVPQTLLLLKSSDDFLRDSRSVANVDAFSLVW